MQMLRNAYLSLHRHHPLLAVVGLTHLAVAILLIVFLPFETRQVMGVNLWIKPLKFFLSSIIYLWTLALFVSYLRDERPRAARFVAWSAAITIVIENVCITLQAARGTTSHFNLSSVFDGVVFSMMGNAIAVNTLTMVYLAWLYVRTSPTLPRAYLWGIRLGLWLFLVGSAVGGVMIGLHSHNVGVSMGGKGLPFTNWSTVGGDLRLAHFLGLHALQLIPLAGYLIARAQPEGTLQLVSTDATSVHTTQSASTVRAVVYVAGVAIAYTGLIVLLYLQAMRGLPLTTFFR
jgi:hypothetical protein